MKKQQLLIKSDTDTLTLGYSTSLYFVSRLCLLLCLMAF